VREVRRYRGGRTDPADQYIDGLGKFHAGLKAVRIENETWRLILMPESNGKIVEMTHKPTGRNVIQPARALNRFPYENGCARAKDPALRASSPTMPRLSLTGSC